MNANKSTEQSEFAGSPTSESQKPYGSHVAKRKSHNVLIGVIFAVVAIFLVVFTALGVTVNIGRNGLTDTGDSIFSYKTMRHDGVKYEYNDDMVSICVIGTDRLYGYGVGTSNGCADAVLVLAFDTSTGKMTLINVPRNTYTTVPVKFDNGLSLASDSFIGTAYAYADNDTEGSENVCNAVSILFGDVPMNNYVTLLESAIGPLSEAVGGVTVTAVDDVPPVGIKKGETYTLVGEQALRYVQYRNLKIISSPRDRSERQRDFAQAFMKQAVSAMKQDPAVLQKIYDILTNPEYMTTNLDIPELAYLVTTALQTGIGNLDMVTIPYDEERDGPDDISAYISRQDELLDLILDVYYKPVE